MDAKIFAMIDDMSRAALLDALGNPETEVWQDTEYLRSAVRQQYETGVLDGADVVMAWEDDPQAA